jgi:hypothetical protein
MKGEERERYRKRVIVVNEKYKQRECEEVKNGKKVVKGGNDKIWEMLY